MELSQLRLLAAELNNENVASSVPVGDVAEVLSFQQTSKVRTAAYVLRLTAEQDISAVQPIEHTLTQQLRTEDPIVRSELTHAVALVGQRDYNVLKQNINKLINGLDATDSRVRLQSAEALLNLAEKSPESLSPYINKILPRVNDNHPYVRMTVFQLLSSCEKSDITQTTEAIPEAVSALSHGNESIRINALYFLTEVAQIHPEDVASHTDSIRTALCDPVGEIRGQAAYIITEIANSDLMHIESSLNRLVELLTDPETLARQNGSHALLKYGQERPRALPIGQIGSRLSKLLETDIVAVQRNAIYLASTVISQKPSVVRNPDTVESQVRQLRADPVVDVEESVFDQIFEGLSDIESEKKADTDRAANGKETYDTAHSFDSNNPNQTLDKESESNSETDTKVFYSTEENELKTMCPSCDADLDPNEDAKFCPECGHKL